MSRNFPAVTTSFVFIGDITTARFEQLQSWSVLVFIRIENTTGDDRAVIALMGTNDTQQFLWRVDAGTAPQELEVYTSNLTRSLTSGADIELNTWYLLALLNDGTGNASGLKHYIYDMDSTLIDNVNDQHDGDAINPGGNFGDTEIGRSAYSVLTPEIADAMDGDIAYACYVDDEISQQEIEAYLVNPVRMAKVFKQVHGVSWFFPLGMGAPEADWSGSNNNGTVNGSPTISAMPPVARFTSMMGGIEPIDVVVSGRIMSSLVGHGGLAGMGGIAGQGGGLAG